jgi:hypothetical protein
MSWRPFTRDQGPRGRQLLNAPVQLVGVDLTKVKNGTPQFMAINPAPSTAGERLRLSSPWAMRPQSRRALDGTIIGGGLVSLIDIEFGAGSATRWYAARAEIKWCSPALTPTARHCVDFPLFAGPRRATNRARRVHKGARAHQRW